MTGTEIRWSAERVAEEIGMSVRSAQELLRLGDIPSQKKGRKYLVKPSDVVAWADRQPAHEPAERDS